MLFIFQCFFLFINILYPTQNPYTLSCYILFAISCCDDTLRKCLIFRVFPCNHNVLSLSTSQLQVAVTTDAKHVLLQIFNVLLKHKTCFLRFYSKIYVVTTMTTSILIKTIYNQNRT